MALPHSSENRFAAHLHVRSGFSYAQGVAYPQELAAATTGTGYHYLSLTDRDGMYGIPRFLAACAKQGVSPIVGEEITVEAFAESGHLVLLCESMEGYAALCSLISTYRTAPGPDGEHPSAKERRFPLCPLETLLEKAGSGEGLVCLTGAIPHGLLARLVERGKWVEAKRLLGLPGPGHRPTDQLYMKPAWKMECLFRDYPQALAGTAKIAERCAGAVSLGGEVLVPAYRATKEDGREVSAKERLLSLVLRGARERYGKQTPWVKARLRRELSCIGELGFTSYFLFAHEAKEIASEKGTPVTGRGSGANSLVAYCLGLTQPDPFEHRLLFERFMHEGRTKDPPDIDMDLCSELSDDVRDELISRYSEYGAGVAATAATFSLLMWTFYSRKEAVCYKMI